MVDAWTSRSPSSAPLGDDATAPLRVVLRFVGADWPLIGGAFSIGGLAVPWPTKLTSTVREPGPHTGAEVAATHRGFAAAFSVA